MARSQFSLGLKVDWKKQHVTSIQLSSFWKFGKWSRRTILFLLPRNPLYQCRTELRILFVLRILPEQNDSWVIVERLAVQNGRKQGPTLKTMVRLKNINIGGFCFLSFPGPPRILFPPLIWTYTQYFCPKEYWYVPFKKTETLQRILLQFYSRSKSVHNISFPIYLIFNLFWEIC